MQQLPDQLRALLDVGILDRSADLVGAIRDARQPGRAYV
jgi:hypothetical protein